MNDPLIFSSSLLFSRVFFFVFKLASSAHTAEKRDKPSSEKPQQYLRAPNTAQQPAIGPAQSSKEHAAECSCRPDRVRQRKPAGKNKCLAESHHVCEKKYTPSFPLGCCSLNKKRSRKKRHQRLVIRIFNPSSSSTASDCADSSSQRNKSSLRSHKLRGRCIHREYVHQDPRGIPYTHAYRARAFFPEAWPRDT